MCPSLEKSFTLKSFLWNHGILPILPSDIKLIGSMHPSVYKWKDSRAMICQVCFPHFASQYVSSLVPISLSFAVRIPSPSILSSKKRTLYFSFPNISCTATLIRPHHHPSAQQSTYISQFSCLPSPPTTSLPPRFSQPEPPTPSPEATPPMRPPTPPSRS